MKTFLSIGDSVWKFSGFLDGMDLLEFSYRAGYHQLDPDGAMYQQQRDAIFPKTDFHMVNLLFGLSALLRVEPETYYDHSQDKLKLFLRRASI